MKPSINFIRVVVLAFAFLTVQQGKLARAEGLSYKGTCDASAAVPVGASHILVANDETDVFHLYAVGSPDSIKTFDMTEMLQEDGREADIEGATRLGNTRITYWITSHGRNKDGKLRKDRYRLFGLRLEGAPGAELDLHMVGQPFKRLVEDLLDAGTWQEPDPRVISVLREKTQLSQTEVAALAPKEEGLNIEGLAANPFDNTLLIGFRNPLIDRKALVVELMNPADVLSGGNRAQFGRPILLELGGLGIRAIEYSPQHGVYFILAGPVGSDGSSYLATWSGDKRQDPIMLRSLEGGDNSNPEAIVVNRHRNSLQILFDEGTRSVAGTECKDLQAGQQSFSGRDLDLAVPPDDGRED